MNPVIALVGRTNVGKSTLFNRLTHTRDALVAHYSGLTRDRQYGSAQLDDRRCVLIDTAGIQGQEEDIDAAMIHQSWRAVEEADVVLFMVDVQQGRTVADELLAADLRKCGKKTILVANKVDRTDERWVETEFAALGLGPSCAIAAAHGRGIHTLIQQTIALLPPVVAVDQETDETADDPTVGIKLAIVGRPNVGKSTLVNRMLGEERVVVYDHAGTTRDSIYIPYERQEQRYTLIDTAGVRRRGKVKLTVEKFSVIKTLQAIEDAHVAILVLDAQEGLVDQDLHLLSFILNSGRACVLALNKWDGLSEEHKNSINKHLDRRLDFIDFVRIHRISAKYGSGVGDLYQSISEAYAAATSRWTTNKLTQLLTRLVQEHQPPMVRGRRIKLRHCHMGGSNPPTLVIHGNQTESLPQSYQRYLENQFRKQLGIMGTPLKLSLKTSENPFSDRKNTLTQRQVKHKQRLLKHVQKHDKKKKKKR